MLTIRQPIRALRPEHALLHPMWLGALALLIANDHFFKGAGLLHEVATGKLSDFAGMIVAPALLAALLRLRSRRAVLVAHLAVAVVFAMTEITPAGARLMEDVVGLFGIRWRMVADLTDLLALPMLFASWRWLVPAMERPLAPRTRAVQALRLSAGTVGLLACVGTSQVREPAVAAPASPEAVVAAPAPSPATLATLLGHRWRAKNKDGTWQLSYSFQTDQRYTGAGVPSWEESGRVELVETHGRTLHIRFLDRIFDGQSDEPVTRALILAEDGASFSMNGDVYLREDDGATVAIEDDGSQDR